VVVVTRTGLILDDRYQLAEPIAAGGVGQVWRASDLLLDREVAVKLLRPDTPITPTRSSVFAPKPSTQAR
jgi:serine/threonine-protein kinase